MTSRFILLDEAFVEPPAVIDPGEDVGSLLGALGLSGATYHSFTPSTPSGNAPARNVASAIPIHAAEKVESTVALMSSTGLYGPTPVAEATPFPPVPAAAQPRPAVISLSQVFHALHGRLPLEPSRTRSLREVFRDPRPQG